MKNRWAKWKTVEHFIGAKDDEGGCDNWIYKKCKAAVRSAPPTNNTQLFTDRVLVLSPKQQRQSIERNSGMVERKLKLSTSAKWKTNDWRSWWDAVWNVKGERPRGWPSARRRSEDSTDCHSQRLSNSRLTELREVTGINGCQGSGSWV